MTVGETLLKITDYPFSFSITFLILRAEGIKDIFSDQTAIILLIAGFIGTSLTILDPIGRIAKHYFLWIAKLEYLEPEKQSTFEKIVAKYSKNFAIQLTGLLNKFSKNDVEVIPEDFKKIDWTYIRSAFHTKAIELEKDKIVSTYYFLITLAVAVFVIKYSGIFADHFPNSLTQSGLCGVDCAKSITEASIWFLMLCVSVVLIINGTRFFNKLLIVATYLSSLGLKEVPRESTESVYQFIEIGDWQTAEYWRRQIQDDIRYKRGMRDLVIKSSEEVYDPLYTEFVRLETVFQKIELEKHYISLSFGAWTSIKDGLKHLSVTDGEFIEGVDSFQKDCNKYQYLLNHSNLNAPGIILKHLSVLYSRNVTNVSYTVNTSSGAKEININNLAESAIFGSTPNFIFQNAVPLSLSITATDQTGRVYSENMIGTELNKFITGWDPIIYEVKNMASVQQLELTYGKIMKNVTILKDMCEKQNKLKYRVF